MSHEKLIAAIRITIEDIDEEFIASDPLLRLGKIKDFDFIETAASASILQSFYTGIENLVLYLFKTLDGSVPQTPSWHRDLLDLASTPTPKRSAIFNQSTRTLMTTYLDYRHVVRHGYAKHLRSDRTKELLLAAPLAWEEVKKDLELFIESLKK